MRDPRLDKLAQVLVTYSVGVKKGDLVRISGAAAAEPEDQEAPPPLGRLGAQPHQIAQPQSADSQRASLQNATARNGTGTAVGGASHRQRLSQKREREKGDKSN